MTVPLRKQASCDIGSREKVLVLVDEIDAKGLPPRSRDLIKAMRQSVEPILVAQCYRKIFYQVRKLPCRHEFYGFQAKGYEASIKALATELMARYAPSWVIAYGWENAQLIVELKALDVPVVIFVDYPSMKPSAEEQIGWAGLVAEAILATQKSCLRSHELEIQNLSSETPKPQSFFDRIFKPRSGAAGRRQIVEQLIEIGRRAAVRRANAIKQAYCDEATIRASNHFNTALFLTPPEQEDDEYNGPIARYLRASRYAAPRRRAVAGRTLRRPVEGFHPLIYATDSPTFDEARGEDPLAHYLRQGRPAGRWGHDIIRDRLGRPPKGVRTALHAHIHYTDLLPELLERLGANETQADLFITTTSDVRRNEIAAILTNAGITPAAIICDSSNRGRDVWPFLNLLGSGAFVAYDVVGHVHGKRSPNYERSDDWRTFLWRHLVGCPERMMDAVIWHFMEDTRLGLVMPEDPHLEGWMENRAVGTELAKKMGISLPLPTHFEFPKGTMFWARPAALAPLLDLGMNEAMMPPEPLAEDGTILHAFERLIPFAVDKAGFRTAATYVPGSMRY